MCLQLIAVLYGQTIARGKGLIDLAAYLGLKRDRRDDDETHEVKAVLLRKLHGNRPVYSVGLYDKRRRVSQMKQGRSLTDRRRRRSTIAFGWTSPLSRMGWWRSARRRDRG